MHILLVQGQQILEDLFPRLQEELGEAGALVVDWTYDYILFGLGRWAPRFRSGFMARLCTRDLLEWTIRSRLVQESRIQFMDEREVV